LRSRALIARLDRAELDRTEASNGDRDRDREVRTARDTSGAAGERIALPRRLQRAKRAFARG